MQYGRRNQKNDITRLSFWAPKLERCGLPVPKTILVEATGAEICNAQCCLEEGVEPKDILSLVDRIKVATDTMGYPCFLRTDHTAGKHNWENTCYVSSPDKLLGHILGIIEYSMCAGFFGLPCDVWAVREMLPVRPRGVCVGYGNMPVIKEFRYFVDGYNIECWHPYWPEDALQNGGIIWNVPHGDSYRHLCTPTNCAEMDTLAKCVGCAVSGGRWSVDIIETEKGWYITDMAEADKSFHWDGCEVAAKRNKEKEETTC